MVNSKLSLNRRLALRWKESLEVRTPLKWRVPLDWRNSLNLKCIVFAGLFFFCCMVQAGMAGEYKLPDTGIEKCYDNNSEIACPSKGEPFYGQDAQYNGPAMAYQDNGNGTVTDLNTQLMWQQSDDGVEREWQDACDYCDNLDFAGYADWRIPTRRELFSIVDLGKYDPAINTDYFPACKSSWYWSGSTRTGSTDGAWVVDFYFGIIGWGGKTNDGYVRCVRSGP
ncbi:MAG: DUF1566 domain-containing protein [Thermodesulfobacteriota bacterium]|nr:DUF1566 domain-containing protein [Thermodesulfobacteriota bacterium]